MCFYQVFDDEITLLTRAGFGRCQGFLGQNLKGVGLAAHLSNDVGPPLFGIGFCWASVSHTWSKAGWENNFAVLSLELHGSRILIQRLGYA